MSKFDVNILYTAELERRVAKAEERERLSRDECAVRDSRLRDLDSRCAYLQGLLDR